MKLLFCPACSDIFKLIIAERRSCICGNVQGQLLDNDLARTNGRGVSVVVGNGSLAHAIAKLNTLKQDKNIKFYQKQTPVLCWVRPHSGPGNPRTRIEKEGDAPLGDSIVLLRHAVVQYRQEHPEISAIPEWVDGAERMLALIRR